MSKSAMKQSVKAPATSTNAKPPQFGVPDGKGQKAEAGSKQSRVIAMLQSASGATIGAMIETTGWQQHSVRGFLAGVVRKRLKLKIASKKVDGERFYRIARGHRGKPSARTSKRQST